jgi:FKBP-type peptidyl-prolyl cis-trans isomerase
MITVPSVAIVYSIFSQKKGTTNMSSTNKLQGTKLANFTPVSSVSQLEAADTSPGTGAIVKAGDTVTVDYTGAVASTGIIFQSSKDSGQPVTFPLNQVIAGWSQGIPGMKVGGTRRLLIPANLAYGANPPAGSGIPANADLVFDVTLHSIGK